MATRYTDGFRRDAVRNAITSGLTRPQVSSDLSVGRWAFDVEQVGLATSVARQGIVQRCPERFLCRPKTPLIHVNTHCRAMDDMVLLARIREQHRLNLESYGRPRMAEKLQELGLNVGHRRVGRLMHANGKEIVRTHKYKATTIAWQAIAKQSAERGTATTRSTSRPTCWIRTSLRTAQSKMGRRHQLHLDQ
jgi:transposase InsO family protein